MRGLIQVFYFILNILAAGASPRELDWWSRLNQYLSKHDIKYLNCSSRKYKNCINLKQYSEKIINFSPSINDKYNIPISYLIHEHNVYPKYSFRKLVTKFETHLRAYENLFKQNNFDLVIVENGGFIFINSLLVFCKKINLPIIIIEGSDEPDKFFAFINNKGPNLKYAIKTPNPKSNTNLKNLNVLIQKKDQGVDQRFKSSLFNQIKTFIKYLDRRIHSNLISTDGSITVVLELKIGYLPKKLIIYLHKLKANIYNNFSKSKERIIFPMHLERDLHITERTNFHSQTDFLINLTKKIKNKKICFKLHPHSIILGPSIFSHIKLLFSKAYICNDKPSELDQINDEVHTLGSKYGLQAARNNIKTFNYGDTFFKVNKKNSEKEKHNINKLKLDEHENIYPNFRHELYLYEENREYLKISAETIEEIMNELFKN